MPRTMLAIAALSLIFAAGCQDQEARERARQLQDRLDQIERGKGSGNDALVAALLAREGSADFSAMERRLNTLGEDLRAGLEGIRALESSIKDGNRRMEELDARVRRVGDMEASLASLRAMLDAMDAKLKNIDPNEVLTLHKELINKDAELRFERQALDATKERVGRLEAEVTQLKADNLQLKADAAGLSGEDISRHPSYVALNRQLRETREELNRRSSDLETLQRLYDQLEQRLREGGARVETPAPGEIELEGQAMSGVVDGVSKPANNPTGPSNVVISIVTGRPPPIGAELLVLDANQRRICSIRVARHYHLDDNTELPINGLGCHALDEQPTRPITRGDTVVWIRGDTEETPRRSAGGE
jgi:hypothetical protein